MPRDVQTSGGDSACSLNVRDSAPSRRGTDPRTTRAAGRGCGRPAAAAGRRRGRSSRRSCGRSRRSRQDVAVAVPDRAVERAEVAARDADVGVVDVAVDDVGDDALGMLARAHRVRQPAEHLRRRLAVQRQRLGGVEAPAGIGLGDDRVEPARSRSTLRIVPASATAVDGPLALETCAAAVPRISPSPARPSK